MSEASIYDMARHQAQGQFASYWEGCPQTVVGIICSQWLDTQSRDALQKSFAALGYGDAACTFVNLEPTGAPKLTARELHCMIEAFDPLILILGDQGAAELCSQAYRQPIPLHRPLRLSGRDARAFASLASWIQSPLDKHRAWALLKSLPALGK